MELRWPTDRIDYVPITQREPLPLPDGARLIVWPCVNVEHWVISEPMPRTVVAPPGGAATRVLCFTMHPYIMGSRIGRSMCGASFNTSPTGRMSSTPRLKPEACGCKGATMGRLTVPEERSCGAPTPSEHKAQRQQPYVFYVKKDCT